MARSRSRPAPVHHGEQRERESRDQSPAKTLHDRTGKRELGDEQREPRRHQQRGHAVAPSQSPSEEDALGKKREQREACKAEQADGHRRLLDRGEKAQPMQREHDAVRDEPNVEGGPHTRAQEQDAERDGGDRRASKHDSHRRQRQPLAEQPREAEKGDGGVQCDQGGRMAHRSASIHSFISPDLAPYIRIRASGS